jgi:hypothetical protein
MLQPPSMDLFPSNPTVKGLFVYGEGFVLDLVFSASTLAAGVSESCFRFVQLDLHVCCDPHFHYSCKNRLSKMDFKCFNYLLCW